MLSTIFSPLIGFSLYSHSPLWRENLSQDLLRVKNENEIERLKTVTSIVPACSLDSAYDFPLCQYFTSKKAATRQMRTTSQCLMAHFQNGPSSVDSRRKNSVKRSITSPTGKVSIGISYGVVSEEN